MSEDVDIKDVLTPLQLKKGRGDRFRLSTLQAPISELLNRLGFPLLEVSEGGENPRVSDGSTNFLTRMSPSTTQSNKARCFATCLQRTVLANDALA